MSVLGFPDLIRFATINRNIVNTKIDLTQASNELVTGTKSDLSRVLGGRAGEYNLVTKALADIESGKSRSVLAGNRVSQTGLAIDSIHAAVSNFSVDAVSTLLNNGSYGLAEIKQAAQQQIESTLSHLNSSHAGRSLFAGDDVHGRAVGTADTMISELTTAIGGAVDEPTIDAAITAYFAPGGGFDTSIYEGGAGQAAAVELNSGVTIQYQVKADNAAFRDTLEGLARVYFAPGSTSQSWADGVAQKLNRGLDGMLALRADLGRQENLVDESLDMAEQEKIILNETKTSLDGVDPFEAASRVQALEAQLQSAYTVASRINRLSFTNFI
ncbi:MAG: flagellin [Parvularcula sp.]